MDTLSPFRPWTFRRPESLRLLDCIDIRQVLQPSRREFRRNEASAEMKFAVRPLSLSITSSMRFAHA
jgi:hypothetical protein